MYFLNVAEFRDTAPLIFYTSFDTPLFWKSFLQFYTVIKFLTRFLYCKKFYKILYVIWNLIKRQLFNLWSGFFSFAETPYTFPSWVVCRPLIKVSTNVCVIASNFTGRSSRFQQRGLLSRCVSLLSMQDVNYKLMQQS